MNHRVLAICLDFGDTLADEATEVKDSSNTTLSAELIPGAGELIRELKRREYPLALVADGRPDTYTNVLSHHGLLDSFDAFAISEEVGVEKPDGPMFTCALDRLNIPPQHYGQTVMVGNYLARDIKGANALGMVSVWLDWSPRREKTPADESEIPAFTIKTPLDLLDVIALLEERFSTCETQIV
ncbi:MAG: HAD family hydrolase [Anaerolineae bacterium]|nr:HAD family hydrolase [Anaerolineae bacterium]